MDLSVDLSVPLDLTVAEVEVELVLPVGHKSWSNVNLIEKTNLLKHWNLDFPFWQQKFCFRFELNSSYKTGTSRELTQVREISESVLVLWSRM